MAKTKFDVLHIASLTDGDWGMKQLRGLSRLSPFIYMGSDFIGDVTCTGYYNCPDLAHFRVAVREIRRVPDAEDNPIIGNEEANRKLTRPNMYDLDTRNLYFGQENTHPALTKIVPGQQSTTFVEDRPDTVKDCKKRVRESIGGGTAEELEDCEDQEKEGPEGAAVKGLPMRLQKVHFRAFGFNQGVGGRQVRQTASDEYAAYFLCSNPVGPHGATGGKGQFSTALREGEWMHVAINSDFELQKRAHEYQWTRTRWTQDGNVKTAEACYQRRLVMGDPLSVGSGGVGTHFVNNMNQVFRLGFDPEAFVLRNAAITKEDIKGDKKKREKEKKPPMTDSIGGTMPGFGYQMPLGIGIESRFIFDRGAANPIRVDPYPGGARESDNLNVDHFSIKYLTEPGGRTVDGGEVKYATKKTDLLLRRPKPFVDAYIAAYYGGDRDPLSGEYWEPREFTLDVARALCTIFQGKRNDDPPRFVTAIYSTDCALNYSFVELNGCQALIQGGTTPPSWAGGQQEIIRFTRCDEAECEPSSSSSKSSSSSSKSSSSSSSSFSSSSESVSSESKSSESSQSIPPGWVAPRYCEGRRGSSSSSEEPT